jgi:hypothetical protein
LLIGPLQGDPAAFTEYLQQYRNTICGRHPIAVLLQVRGGFSCNASLKVVVLGAMFRSKGFAAGGGPAVP